MITKTPQSAALDIVIDKLNTELGIKIFVGPLPKDGGITAEINNGVNKGRYLNKQHGKEQLTVLFLCKNTSQNAAFDALSAIGNILNTLKPEKGDTVYISGAEVRSGAGLVGNDGGFYVYSMIAGIDIVF
ncbi:MAG: hypothetical protein IJY73_02270 [Oscillospiraceae bacterium]|nr:hypothetical protein [Oscillospiraceae bacterium]